MRGYKKVKDFDNSNYKGIDLAEYPPETFETPFEEEWIPSEKAMSDKPRITAKEFNEIWRSRAARHRKKKENNIHSSLVGEERYELKKYGERRAQINWFKVRDEIKKKNSDTISL